MTTPERLQAVWSQREIPVIVRLGKGVPLRVRLPYHRTNWTWLRNGQTRKPKWIEGRRFFELPKAWFNGLVERCLKRYGSVYIVQPFREQEICASACMNAQGHDCSCSCMGANHGAGNDGSWFEVGEYFSTRWKEKEVACRLMVRKPSS